jgi:general secretion pathway protein K
MNRRGFALFTVLWVVAALSSVVGASALIAKTGSLATRNRIALTRGDWAREACLEILLARYARDHSLSDTVDLGRGTWCRVQLENIGAKLDLNQTSPEALRRIIGSDSLVDALLDWRDRDELPRPLGAEADWYRAASRRLPRNGPLADITELRLVRGFDSSRVAQLSRLLDASGSARLDINAAPPELLSTLPGVTPELVSIVLQRRARGEQVKSAEALLALLSPAGRASLLGRYQEFTRQAVFAAPGLRATVEGGVRGSAPVSRSTVYLVPTASRLAVVGRRTE